MITITYCTYIKYGKISIFTDKEHKIAFSEIHIHNFVEQICVTDRTRHPVYIEN